MTRQARKLSGLGTYQGVWYRHASAVTAGGPLFWSNTIVVAYVKMITALGSAAFLRSVLAKNFFIFLTP